MITEFLKQKMRKAKYKILKDRSLFGNILGLKGVWASARTKEACRQELQEVLEEWLILKLRSGERIPGLIIPNTSSSRTHHSSARQYA